MIAILASPRFLYRVEGTLPLKEGEVYPLLDEFSLASRLSYLLWSTMPDEELLRLADRGQLREQLGQQVDRMIADPRSDAFIENFVGQWLRTRDVAHVRIESGAVLAADIPLAQLEAEASLADTAAATAEAADDAAQTPPGGSAGARRPRRPWRPRSGAWPGAWSRSRPGTWSGGTRRRSRRRWNQFQ